MARKPRVLVCDDSERERMRFYTRQFDNFEVYGVEKIDGKFVERVILDSPQALYREVLKLRKAGMEVNLKTTYMPLHGRSKLRFFHLAVP
jgi:hypothetical protein